MCRLVAVFLGLAGFGFVAQGCEAEQEEVASTEDAIINGSPDTTTKAVVWLFDENQGASCSGTIINVNGGTGYVLTAAHCSNMDYVIIADNYEDCFNQGDPGCEAVFAVDQQIYHPSYNDNDPGQGYDFSLIRFSGASAGTPYIPAASSPDGLTEGAQVDIVGYGQTESGNNSLRRHKVTSVTNIYGNVFFDHYSTVCFGDSGGPAIFNGKVVGVSSFVTDNYCQDYGFSVRVRTVYDDWILPFVGEPVPPPPTTSASTGAGPGTGVGGSSGTDTGSGAGSNVGLDPDEDWEWYPGKQDDEFNVSSCAASGTSGSSGPALAWLALSIAALAASMRRRS